MGFFSKLFKGPEIDLEQSAANAARMRGLFDAVVPEGGKYRLIFGYTEDVRRFNYGFVHGSKTKIGNLIVGWDEAGEPTFYRRSEIQKASRNKYPSQNELSRWGGSFLSGDSGKKSLQTDSQTAIIVPITMPDCAERRAENAV